VRYSGNNEGAIFWMEHSVVWWIGSNVLKIFAASFFSLSTSVLTFSHFAVVMIDGNNQTAIKVWYSTTVFSVMTGGVEQVKIIECLAVRKCAQDPNCVANIFIFLDNIITC
jgi:hypothetical protein